MSNHTTDVPQHMRPDFSVRQVPSGFLLMDGDTPVSGHPFASRASANSCMRECQSRREVERQRFISSLAQAAEQNLLERVRYAVSKA